MKHINFKLGIKVFIMAFVFLINMLGCTKDKIVAEKNIDPNVISEIKKIVGQNGEIKLLSNSINLSSQTFKLNNDTVKLLSLLEFKSAFDLLNTDSTLLTAILIDSPSNEGIIKSSTLNSNVYIDRPRQPGLYRYSFSPMVNGNTSYFSNYLFGSDAQRVKTHGAPVQVADDASAVDDDTWRIIRGGKSNIRMDSTYLFLDSVSKSGKFDRLTALMLGAAEGKLKVKFLDIDLNKTLVFNDFEGFRLGVGLETNERMLKFLRVGGFFGYGFRDKTWKYGGHMRWIFVSQMQFQARASYQFDVSPTGLFSFQDPTGRIDQGELIRTAYIRQMDYVESYAFDLGSYLFRSAHLKITTASKNVQTGYAYSFQFPENAQTASNFSLFETGAEFNWRIKDRYIQMGSTRLNLNEPRFPVIQVQYTQGLDNLLNGTINYSRFLVRISQQFLWFRFGQLSIRGEYQKTLGNVPVPLLIYTPGILLRQFGVGSNNIFETVRPNEFLNDELLTGFFRFNFNPWVWKKNKLEPIVSLRFNAGVGRLNNIERHQEIQFSTMNRGFYEAGVVFERLINAGIAGYGLGIYYRLGAYSAVKPIENIAFKLTLSLGS